MGNFLGKGDSIWGKKGFFVNGKIGAIGDNV